MHALDYAESAREIASLDSVAPSSPIPVTPTVAPAVPFGPRPLFAANHRDLMHKQGSSRLDNARQLVNCLLFVSQLRLAAGTPRDVSLVRRSFAKLDPRCSIRPLVSRPKWHAT